MQIICIKNSKIFYLGLLSLITLDHIFACKLLVLERNTWNHITECKQMIIIK